MADRKPVSRYFENLGGINLKASKYTTQQTQFLDIRNMDFDVPNALQKRPGSTQAVAVATSGPIIGLFDFQRLNGASWVIAGSNTALFYLASNAYTLLDPGWNNGQPQDMLTFVNKFWVADGGRYKSWDGSTMYPVGMPCPRTLLAVTQLGGGPSGATIFLTGGATFAFSRTSASWVVRAFYVAYSYVRGDGYFGPVDFLSTARNVISQDGSGNTVQTTISSEDIFTYIPTVSNMIGGFTATAYATAIAMWVGVDSIKVGDPANEVPAFFSSLLAGGGFAQVPAGNLGQLILGSGPNSLSMSYTLKPTADTSRFYLYTLLPIGSTQVTFIPFFNDYTGIATGTRAFTGMPFCWFDTNTPKYIDVNQNVMFMSGFSSAPSTIWYSDIGLPEKIRPTSFFEVRTNDGDRVIGHRAFNGLTVVFKETSFHKILGTTPEDFQLIELSLEFGAVSNKAVVEYNERLVWLDRKGIVQFDGAGWNIISDAIDPIFRRMNLSAAYEKAVAVHHHYRNQLWFGIPIDGSTENNLTIVYDYLIGAWTFFDGYNASSFSFIKGVQNNKQTVWRGSPSGMVYYHGESFFGDNGAGISCVPFSRFEQFEGENSTNVWRRLFLDVGSVSGLTGVISGRVFTDYDSSTVKATFTMYQNVFQSKAEMGVVGKAVAVQFSHYSASLPFLLNGFSWAKRNLRNV